MGHKDVYRVEVKDGWPGVDRADSLTEILKRGELRHSRLLKMGSGCPVDETSKRSTEAEQFLKQSIHQLKANQQRESNRRSQVSKAGMGQGRNISGTMREMLQPMDSALNMLRLNMVKSLKVLELVKPLVHSLVGVPKADSFKGQFQ